ncbi:MAG: ATP synthase F1 subunit gamma [Cryomorphaceae bacterium]|nr:MAG: ATP synthase F1 subunit gamma [Cryomorphaceae bacterium]
MANLKEIRSRITSVNSTMQITAAMKMVSAAKLKRAQDKVIQMRPYAGKLQMIMQNVSSAMDAGEGVYSAQRELKNVLYVVISSNRGLCGGFNNQVIKQTNVSVEEHRQRGEQVHVLPLGKKVFDKFKKTDLLLTEPIGKFPYEIQNDLTFEAVAALTEQLMELFRNGTYDKIMLVYNSFKNAAVQVCMNEQFLPIVPPVQEGGAEMGNIDYIFEPNKEEIITTLIPQSLKTQMFKALLDSTAAEHGARMTAMHKATDNASELSKSLKLTYNKARQAAITAEILEIVGGAEALNN